MDFTILGAVVCLEPTDRNANVKQRLITGGINVIGEFIIYDQFPIVKTMMEIRRTSGEVLHRWVDNRVRKGWDFNRAATACLKYSGIVQTPKGNDRELLAIDTGNLLEIVRKVCAFYYVEDHPFFPIEIHTNFP